MALWKFWTITSSFRVAKFPSLILRLQYDHTPFQLSGFYFGSGRARKREHFAQSGARFATSRFQKCVN